MFNVLINVNERNFKFPQFPFQLSSCLANLGAVLVERESVDALDLVEELVLEGAEIEGVGSLDLVEEPVLAVVAERTEAAE